MSVWACWVGFWDGLFCLGGGWLCINRALVCYEIVLIRSGSSFAGDWVWIGVKDC